MTFAQHGDAIRQPCRLVTLVADEDGRDVCLVHHRRQLFEERLARRLVQRAKRLVEQQHLRLQGEGARQRGALRLAAREVSRRALRQPIDAEAGEPAAHPLSALAAWHAPQREAERYVRFERAIEQQRLLEDHGHAPAQRRLPAYRRLAFEAHLPLGGPFQQRQYLDQGALSGAIRSQDGQHFAVLHVELRDAQDLYAAAAHHYVM